MSLFNERVYVFLYEEYTKNIQQFINELYKIMNLESQNHFLDQVDLVSRWGLKQSKKTNQSIYSLRMLLRTLNYFKWLRSTSAGGYTAKGISKLGLLLDQYLGESRIKRKAENDRKYIYQSSLNSFTRENRRLEEVLNIRLPDNYF